MSSRMDKYYKEKTNTESRLAKNKDMYENLDDKALDDMELTTNISVIDTDTDNLDLDKLKDYLNAKYEKKDDTIDDTIEEEVEEVELEDTKEYDLSKVIEEAHQNKHEDYDKERYIKLRDTQYDILKNLDIDLENKDTKDEGKALSREETEVINLVNTIEEKPAKTDDDDLMSSLKSSDETEVLKPMVDEEEKENIIVNDEEPDVKPSLVEELEKTVKLSKDDVKKALEEEPPHIDEDEEDDDTKEEEKIEENTFYTGKYKIKPTDYDSEGFDDLMGDEQKPHRFLKVLIVIAIIILICVIIYFIDKYFKLGLFDSIFK